MIPPIRAAALTQITNRPEARGSDVRAGHRNFPDSRARLFETTSPGDALSEVACFANPHGRSPGPSINESMGATRHAIEPHTTPREKNADRFARTQNDTLERGDAEHRYEQLVLVAPPRFLGALHVTASKAVQKRVVGEVKRNLTALPVADIRAGLPRRLATRAG